MITWLPGLFNINEPVIFGLPIAFNPFMLVPFVLVPIVACIITYVAIATGFMEPFSGVQVPWTTPPLISGWLLGGVQGLLVQMLIIAESILIYMPFVKLANRQEEKKL